MAWKVVHQEEHADAKAHLYHVTDGVHGADFLSVPISGLIGRHIRVTVEEEVNECCEKWRGQFACLMRSGVVVSGANCRFCPECGRRL